MVCATELLHPANFCPVCGARLAAPTSDGSAATLPGNTPPPVVTAVPTDTPSENVVYLEERSGTTTGDATANAGDVPTNPHARTYDQVAHPVPEPAPSQPHPQHVMSDDQRRAIEIAASMQPFASHGPLPQPHELTPPPTVDDNPFGDFFGDGPSAWLEDDLDDVGHDGTPRVVGTMILLGALLALIGALADWGYALYRGAGGGESAGLMLLAALLWVWYLTMPREQQHAFWLRRHARMRAAVDRRTARLRTRTEGHVALRRERDRYRAMRDERSRRIAALGESAYRSFRQGTLAAPLQPDAQRVMAIERQMLMQDQRILDAQQAGSTRPES